jgi:DNA polymerase I-like protein with 3'-5' exonuclease and polymerase domains
MTFPFAINDHVSIATEMMQTRLRLNSVNYDVLKQLCYEEREKCQRKVRDLVGHDINVGSPKQVCAFLYDELKLKIKKNKKTGGQTSDENALRELRVQYPQHKAVLNAFIEERKISKKIESYIEIAFDEDGCIPYSANPAGTETNRWSFSKSPRDRGLNAQTLPKVMRIMADAHPGRVFICPDLPQADARIVAWDAKCERLIELFLNPNIHFHLENCVRLFGITREEAYGKDAEGFAWKDRDPRYVLGKAMGHAANYRMAAKRLAMELGIALGEAARLLNFYLHNLYPEISRWHQTRKELIQRVGYLETPYPFNRRRTFYGAWGELMLHGKLAETTWNEACAHVPQSVVADIVNVGMDKLRKALPYVWFHKHDHDSYLASTPNAKLGETCRKALEYLKVELRIHKRPLVMVPEMQVGENYGLLVEWKGEEVFDREAWWAKVNKKLDPEKLRKDLYGYY